MTKTTASDRPRLAYGPAQIDLGTYLREEARLQSFVNKLGDEGINTLADIRRYTAAELFELAPTSPRNRKRFLSFVSQGLITLAPAQG